jgi:hypothetical protein
VAPNHGVDEMQVGLKHRVIGIHGDQTTGHLRFRWISRSDQKLLVAYKREDKDCDSFLVFLMYITERLSRAAYASILHMEAVDIFETLIYRG